LLANKAFMELMDAKADALKGVPVADLFKPESRQRLRDVWLELGAKRLVKGIEAECAFTTLSEHAGQVDVVGRCDKLSLSLGGTASQAFSENARALVEQQLHTPFFFTRATTGRVLRAALDPSLDPLVAGLFRGLIAGFQVVREDGGATRWDVEEVDASGPHLASYHVISGASSGAQPQAIEKRRHDYRGTARSDGTEALTGKVLTNISLQEDGTVAALSEHGTFEMRAEIGLPTSVRTRTSAQLIEQRSVDVAEAERATLTAMRARFSVGALNHVRLSAGAQRTRDENTVAGADLSMLLDAWDDLPLVDVGASDDEVADGFDTWGSARARLQARLEALVRLDGDAAAEMSTLLREADLDADLAATLTAALGSSGTASAQSALLDVSADPSLATEQRQHAMVEASLVNTPTNDTLTRIGTVFEQEDGEMRDTAALALGNAAAGARVAGTTGAADAFQHLVNALLAANDSEEKRVLWLALENTGDERLLTLVPSGIANLDPVVRAAAAGALRLVFSGAASQALLDMSAAADPVVAENAARGLRDRSPLPMIDAVETAMRRAPVASARAVLVQWLASSAADARVSELLVRVAAEDSDEDVRELASQVLRS
jgi:hypothetical protein